MWARVTTGHFQPDKLDEAIRLYRDSVMPEARQQRGFKGAMFLVDRSEGKTLAIYLAENEADLTESETDGYFDRQAVKFADLVSSREFEREHFEVALQV